MVLKFLPVFKLISAIPLLPSACLIAYPADSSVSCYRIEPGTIAGIIGADVLLTLIIVVITYRFASSRQKRIKTGMA